MLNLMNQRMNVVMKSGKTKFAAMLIAACSLAAMPAEGAIMYNFNAGQAGNQGFNGSLGNDFTVNVPILVTSVGVFDDLSNGITNTLSAAIFTRDTANNTGAIVAGTSFDFTNVDPGLLNVGIRLKEIAGGGIILQPGTYTVASWNHSATDLNLNSNVGGFAFAADNGGGLITIESVKRWGLPPGSFPTNVDGNFLFGGGTFEFEIDPNADLGSPIKNASFELIPHADHTPENGFPFSNSLIGWEIIGGPLDAGEWNPSDIQFVGASDQEPDLDTTIPDGLNVAFVNPIEGGIRQVLDMVLSGNEVIELSAWFGDRMEAVGGLSNYELRLLAGGTLLGTAGGSVTDGFVQDTVSVVVPGNHAAIGENLVIEIIKTGGAQLVVDHVEISVNAIPEPASFGLLGLMGLGLLRRRQR